METTRSTLSHRGKKSGSAQPQRGGLRTGAQPNTTQTKERTTTTDIQALRQGSHSETSTSNSDRHRVISSGSEHRTSPESSTSTWTHSQTNRGRTRERRAEPQTEAGSPAQEPSVSVPSPYPIDFASFSNRLSKGDYRGCAGDGGVGRADDEGDTDREDSNGEGYAGDHDPSASSASSSEYPRPFHNPLDRPQRKSYDDPYDDIPPDEYRAYVRLREESVNYRPVRTPEEYKAARRSTKRWGTVYTLVLYVAVMLGVVVMAVSRMDPHLTSDDLDPYSMAHLSNGEVISGATIALIFRALYCMTHKSALMESATVIVLCYYIYLVMYLPLYSWVNGRPSLSIWRLLVGVSAAGWIVAVCIIHALINGSMAPKPDDREREYMKALPRGYRPSPRSTGSGSGSSSRGSNGD